MEPTPDSSESNPELEPIPESKQDADVKHDEHWRLAGRPPLKTILVLSFGPLISQVSSSLFGIVDTMWVSKGLGTLGVSKISSYSAFDNMGRAFGFFMMVACSSQISALFGMARGDEAAQLLVDLLRIAIIFGAMVPTIFLPWIKHAVRAFGATEEVVQDGYNYISTTLGGSVVSCIYMCLGGGLQGEGRTLFLGLANLGSTLLNMLVFDPVLILKTDLGVRGAGIATILSEALPMILIFILYFSKKFTVKPEFNMFFKKFNPQTKKALAVGFSQLIASLSMNIPGVLIMYLTGTATSSPAHYTAALSALNVTFRSATLSFAVCMAISSGYLPAASYSYSRGNSKRWRYLTIHSCWINFLWGSLMTLLCCVFPETVCRFFSSDPDFLEIGVPMLTYGSAGFFLMFTRMNAQAALQSMQRGLRATVFSFSTQLLLLSAFALMYSAIFPHNPEFYQLSYPSTFVVGAIAAVFFLWGPIKEFRLAEKAEEDALGKDVDGDPNIEIEEDLEALEEESIRDV